MIVYEPTTAQQRMDHLAEANAMLRDTMTEWARRWVADDGATPYHFIWQEDGTVVLEVDDRPVARLTVAVEVTATEYVAAVNTPTGFVLPRTWAEVPAGWFVHAPNGEWYEVLGTKLEDGQQHVTLTMGTWPRDPAGKVSVRRGTLTADKAAALDALGADFDVAVLKDDEPPW